MKNFVIFFTLLVFPQILLAESPKVLISPYEIILDETKIRYDKDEVLSIPMTIRNKAKTPLYGPSIYFGLSILWDGKPYKRNPKFTVWNGIAEIIPDGALYMSFSVSEYLIPKKLLSAGEHTVAIADPHTTSNSVVVKLRKNR